MNTIKVTQHNTIIANTKKEKRMGGGGRIKGNKEWQKGSIEEKMEVKKVRARKKKSGRGKKKKGNGRREVRFK